MGILDAIRERPLVAIVVVLSIAAAVILKYSLRRPRRTDKATSPARPRPKKKRRR